MKSLGAPGVERDQTQPYNNYRYRRAVAVPVLAVCAFNLHGGINALADSPVGCLDPKSATQVLADTSYNLDTGQVETVTGNLPDSSKKIYEIFIPSALNDPVVKLAIKNGAVESVVARTTRVDSQHLYASGSTSGAMYTSADSGCNPVNEISLDLDADSQDNSQTSLFANEHYTKMTVAHEALHGLNAAWWQELKQTRAFDHTLDERAYRLQHTCDGINKWVTYENMGKVPTSMNYDNNASVAAICAFEETTHDTVHTREMFACVNEGSMLRERHSLRHEANLGHPWTNPTELASSVTNVLRFDPDYLLRCLSSQDKMETTLIKEYAKIALEFSFAHNPELEKALQQNPATASALDFLIADAEIA